MSSILLPYKFRFTFASYKCKQQGVLNNADISILLDSAAIIFLILLHNIEKTST